jgi:hypothetical protein
VQKLPDLYIFLFTCGSTSGYNAWVYARWVRKKFVFGGKTLQIAIFWYFIVLPPYPLPKTYDTWVQREW